MKIDIRLYGILRDRLPAAAKGRTTLELPPDATVADLLANLEIEQAVAVAVNEDTDIDRSYRLSDGDKIAIFSVIGGG